MSNGLASIDGDTDLCPISDALGPEQLKLVVAWFAQGLSAAQIAELCQDEFEVSLSVPTLRTLYVQLRPQISEYCAGQTLKLRHNPHYQPAFVVNKLEAYISRIEELLEAEMEAGALGPVKTLFGLWTTLQHEIQRYQSRFEPDDGVGGTETQRLLDQLPASERAIVVSHLREINEIMERARRSRAEVEA